MTGSGVTQHVAAERKVVGYASLTHPTSLRVFHTRFRRREFIHRAAELAGYHDLAVLHHLRPVLGIETLQHRGDRLARAGAFGVEGHRLEDAHTALVEEAIQEPLAGQIG